MATLLSTNISDTGYLQLPGGTDAQRPKPAITLAGLWSNTPVYARNGTALTISGNGSAWQQYQNLPNYLLGLQSTPSINDTDGSNWVLPECRVYMIRNPSWNSISAPTGWTEIEASKDYITGYGATLSVYYKDFTAGTYSFDNNSAMYLFELPASSRPMIRWNTSAKQVEVFTPQALNTYNSNKGYQHQWTPMTIPFLNREIITTHFIMGGYKNSTVWKNVNRTIAATDTSASLGDLMSLGANYKGGACGSRRAYTFHAGNAHATNSTATTGFDMIAETTITIPSRSNSTISRGQTGVIFDEKRTAWVMGGDSATIEEFDLLTDTFRTTVSTTALIAGNAGDGGGASGGGPWAMSHDGKGIWYTGESASNSGQQNWNFATKTNSTRSGTQPGAHHQQKAINSKLQYSYAGNEGSYSGGNSYRRTNWATDTSSWPNVASVGSITKSSENASSGEENYTMGQDWQYMLGQHDGAQNNKSAKFTYATETQINGGATLQPKGSTGATVIEGRSSGVTAWRA